MSEIKHTKVRPGIYRHYKGERYQVYEVASHSETEERLVVYRCLYGDYSLWVRPMKMFLETVMIDGCEVPRFDFESATGAEFTQDYRQAAHGLETNND